MSRSRVLVCGGRDFADRQFVFDTLDDVQRRSQHPLHIIEGGADGADRIAREWALAACVPVTTYPANWRRDGKKAGPIRNQLMLDEGKPSLVVGFPGGRGTADMLRRALAADVALRCSAPRTPAKAAVQEPAPATPSGEVPSSVTSKNNNDN